VTQVRQQLDRLGAQSTRIVVTSDLDEYTIAALQAVAVDAYGVGTSVVTGSGHPAAGLVYKLVSRHDDAGQWVPVQKTSTGKTNAGGEKSAYRIIEGGLAREERVLVGTPEGAPGRELMVDWVVDGEPVAENSDLTASREHHATAIAELPADALRLTDGEPAIPTRVA
jgi:nicotinate phosphoribosyltransferase